MISVLLFYSAYLLFLLLLSPWFGRYPPLASPSAQTFGMQYNKEQLISALRTHRINTITELRSAERVLTQRDHVEVTDPLSDAWVYYVNSNNLLSELRFLTRNYPFSSECLDEAKALTVSDPQSARSWNYCWLVLSKLQEQ